MFTIRAETLSRENNPYRPAQYAVHEATSYFVIREQYDPVNGRFLEGPGPSSSTKKIESNPVQKDWPWRIRIEIHSPKQKFETEHEDVFFIYIGDDEYIHRVFVMNDAGKTVDTIQ
jgi:hypothetical protein